MDSATILPFTTRSTCILQGDPIYRGFNLCRVGFAIWNDSELALLLCSSYTSSFKSTKRSAGSLQGLIYQLSYCRMHKSPLANWWVSPLHRVMLMYSRQYIQRSNAHLIRSYLPMKKISKRGHDRIQFPGQHSGS